MPSERARRKSFAQRSGRVLGGLALLTFGVVGGGARRGHADTPPAAPIASVPPAVSAGTAGPTPPQSPSAIPGEPTPGQDEPAPSQGGSVPHLAVTPPSFTLVDATWDRPIRVLPAKNQGPRAIVYLHGYCGDVNAVGAFVAAAAAHGTLLALLGDQPCKDKPGRFKWSNDIHGLDERIQRAVRLVNRALALSLDPKDITLFGYSQGAVRAESLARYYSRRYPRVILGGPPRRPKPAHFTGVRRIAVFGGELEDTHDMLGAAGDMSAAGEQARFFLLPGVDHGDFGGEALGNRALGEVLDFVDPPETKEQIGAGSGTVRER